MFRHYRVIFKEFVFITVTYVTSRGNEYELSEDDTMVSKHLGT